MPSYRLVKPFDIAIIILLCVTLVWISKTIYNNGNGSAMVEVKTAKALQLYPLDEDRQITVTGPLGETVIEIANQKVRILSSPCRGKLCITKGSLDSNGDWSACLPNRVYVGIKNKDEEHLDELSY